MIAALKGYTTEKLFDRIVVDVSGVGYGVYVTSEDYEAIDLDEEVSLVIYEYVREQAHDLFGFLSRDTQNLFEQLLNVNGVGPKMALSMLSISPASGVREAIAGGDVAFLQQASGVGRRLAERVIVELKDKVGLSGIDIEASGLLNASSKTSKDEATQALMSLGFSAQDAAQALNGIDATLPTEERIKLALKGSSK